MIISWILFFIIIAISVAAGIAIRNQFRRLDLYESYISDYVSQIYRINKALLIIDSRGTFESDDEVGFFFTELKDILHSLNDLEFVPVEMMEDLERFEKSHKEDSIGKIY